MEVSGQRDNVRFRKPIIHCCGRVEKLAQVVARVPVGVGVVKDKSFQAELGGGYWGVGEAGGFRGTSAHWWVIGEGKDNSLCGIGMRPIDIGAETSWHTRCKRCVKSLVAQQEKEAEN